MLEKKTEYSAGPWKTHDVTAIEDGEGLIIIKCGVTSGGGPPYDTRKADARLVACAPEMLEMLQHWVETINDKYLPSLKGGTKKSLESLISKATGD